MNKDDLKLHVFYCSNCMDGNEFNRLFNGEAGEEVTLIGLPCSGKADLLYLLKAFETGADGLALVTCSKHECRYLEGNLRAPKRIDETKTFLEETGMGANRVMVLQMNGHGIGEIVEKIAAFREELHELSSYTAYRGMDYRHAVHASTPVCG